MYPIRQPLSFLCLKIIYQQISEKMDKIKCRLCGKQRNNSNLMNLTAEVVKQISYFCRIELDMKLKVPKKICLECFYVYEFVCLLDEFLNQFIFILVYPTLRNFAKKCRFFRLLSKSRKQEK